MAAGVAEQVDGQFKDNTTALCSLHCTQRAEAARLRQLMLRIDECFIFLFFYVSARPDWQADALCSRAVRPSVRSYVRYCTFEHDILKANEPVLIQLGTRGLR